MKHPALTRVMAVVLAIVCVIMLLASLSDREEAEEMRAEDMASHEKLLERIATYEELSEKLEGVTKYKESNEELEAREESHDDEASQHRTDVATHTATEGGYKQGADALWEAKAQLEEKSWAYYGGLQIYNEKKAEFDKLKAGVDGMATLAAACTQASAQAAATVPVSPPGPAPTEPTAPIEPVAPVEPIAPTAPIMPTLPVAPNAPVAPDRANYDTDEAFAQAQAAYDASVLSYQAAVESYNAAMTQYALDMAAYEAALPAYNENKAIYDAQMITYTAQKTEYDAAMITYTEQKGIYDAAKVQYDADKAAYDAANAAYLEYAGKVQAWTGLMQQGAGILAAMGASAPSTTPDAMGLAAMGMTLQQVQASLQPQIAEGEAALQEAKAGLDEAKKALDSADNTIQGNLENIWYHMGQLEDEAVELTEKKDALAEEAARLEKERELLEQQKEYENKLRSTRILLMQNKPVADSVEAGGDLVESARSYADDFKKQYELLYSGRKLISLLGIVAGALGIIIIPFAFEMIRSRFLLLFPAVLCLIGAAACVNIHFVLGEGAHYAAMPVVLFALVYLLVAFPKKKIITE